jgi:hypothetical protein
VGVQRLGVQAGRGLVARAGDAGGAAAERASPGCGLVAAERIGIWPVATHDQHRQARDGGAGVHGRATCDPGPAAAHRQRRGSVAAAVGPVGPTADARPLRGGSQRWGEVASATGVGDLEQQGGGVDGGQAQERDRDPRPHAAVLVDVPAGGAAPGVHPTHADRRPVAQLAGGEAEIAVTDVRVERTARARPGRAETCPEQRDHPSTDGGSVELLMGEIYACCRTVVNAICAVVVRLWRSKSASPFRRAGDPPARQFQVPAGPLVMVAYEGVQALF